MRMAKVLARRMDAVEGPLGLQVTWRGWAEDRAWKGAFAFESKIKKYHES